MANYDGPDNFLDDKEYPESPGWEEGMFKFMDEDPEVWEERLAQWNPEMLTKWKAFKEFGRMSAERKLREAASSSSSGPAPKSEGMEQSPAKGPPAEY